MKTRSKSSGTLGADSTPVMAAPTRLEELPNHKESPAEIGAHLLDSAAGLARAEVRLLWSHARQIGARIGLALGLTWVAMMLTQIALLLLAISPLIAASYGAAMVVASVAPAAVLAAVLWGLSIKKWLGLNEKPSEQQRAAAGGALELSSGELERR